MWYANLCCVLLGCSLPACILCSVKQMGTNQAPGFGVEQKSGPDNAVEADIIPGKQAVEVLGSEVNQKFAEMCLDTAVETDIISEEQADLEARLEINQKFGEIRLGTCVEAGSNPENQANPETRSLVDQKLAENGQDTVMEADVNPEEQAANAGVIYRCKKCRRMVATQEYVVTHEVGLGERSFSRHNSYHVDEKEPECTRCIFVEPMKWMQAVEEGYILNKLWCMGCKTRLGSFNWAGMQCGCGAWVIPAFQLIKSRIDESQI